jgi:hypothetical protein
MTIGGKAVTSVMVVSGKTIKATTPADGTERRACWWRHLAAPTRLIRCSPT